MATLAEMISGPPPLLAEIPRSERARGCSHIESRWPSTLVRSDGWTQTRCLTSEPNNNAMGINFLVHTHTQTLLGQHFSLTSDQQWRRCWKKPRPIFLCRQKWKYNMRAGARKNEPAVRWKSKLRLWLSGEAKNSGGLPNFYNTRSSRTKMWVTLSLTWK